MDTNRVNVVPNSNGGGWVPLAQNDRAELAKLPGGEAALAELDRVAREDGVSIADAYLVVNTRGEVTGVGGWPPGGRRSRNAR